MMTATVKHFDVLDFVKNSKRLGVSEPVAEYHARQIEQAIDIAVSTAREEIHTKNLATKHDTDLIRKDMKLEIELVRKDMKIEIELVRKDMELVRVDLQKEIISSKNQTILWIITLMLGSGVIQHFFK